MPSNYRDWAARYRVSVGFALAFAYLVFSQPALRYLMLGIGVGLVGLVIRAWAAGHLEKNQVLTRGGPYVFSRNPLYLGSLILGVGLAVAGCTWVLGLVFLAVFALVYWPVIRREEDFLGRQFGETYHHYAGHVPLMFPVLWRRAPDDAGGTHFCWSRYSRNREYQAALGYVSVAIFLLLKLKLH